MSEGQSTRHGRIDSDSEGQRATPPGTPTSFLQAGIDFEHANAARMYDYMLGGAHNFAVDRERVEALRAASPDAIDLAWANRGFLSRVVSWCTARGIDQFLDLGSGVPTVGNVHEIAHQRIPTARVAYVDFEPVAVAHATDILENLDTVTITRADIRDPATILNAPGVAGLLDFTRPIALLAITVLHFVPGDVATLIATYQQALVPGSVVAISHGSADHDDPAVAAAARAGSAAYDSSATPVTLRDRTELHALFGGLDLVRPGLVIVTDWPDHAESRPLAIYGGVAVIPENGHTDRTAI